MRTIRLLILIRFALASADEGYFGRVGGEKEDSEGRSGIGL